MEKLLFETAKTWSREIESATYDGGKKEKKETWITDLLYELHGAGKKKCLHERQTAHGGYLKKKVIIIFLLILLIDQ